MVSIQYKTIHPQRLVSDKRISTWFSRNPLRRRGLCIGRLSLVVLRIWLAASSPPCICVCGYQRRKQNKLIHTIQGYVTYPHYLSNFLVSYGVYREGPTQLTNTCQWCVPWLDFAQIRIGKVVCVSVCAVSVSSTVYPSTR